VVAFQFIDELEQTTKQLARHPLAGSFRYSYELNLPELRTWAFKTLPYLIFYVAKPNSTDVWRILHNKRGLPAWLGSTETPS